VQAGITTKKQDYNQITPAIIRPESPAEGFSIHGHFLIVHANKGSKLTLAPIC
jgi:hypothetical protein